MKKRINRLGFTMAELLIVVAIIGVLAGVAFVAVQQHERSMERLERDSVAREIFVAAQNHLTMAESQGYLGLSDSDIFGNVDAESGVYYFAFNQESKFSDGAPKTLLDLMLPFGAIDDTVRVGGRYIIRYHPDTATVMDVFYCSSPETDKRFGYDLSGADLSDLVANWRDGKESARRNYNGKVLGWYGGASAETLSRTELNDPEIVVENGSKLRVGIVDNNPGTGSLRIIVTGVTSKVQTSFLLKSTEAGYSTTDPRIVPGTVEVADTDCAFAVILDDITTANLHFANLTGTKDNATGVSFIPGEDVTIQAIAFDNTQISNIAYSAEVTTNSLFEKVDTATAGSDGKAAMTASVANIRHLENLDKRVSNVTISRTEGTAPNQTTYVLGNAVQTSDISWTKFKEDTAAETTAIQLYTAGTTSPGCYLPVTPADYTLSYNGQGHSIRDIMVDNDGPSGLFGALTGSATEPLTISHLALIDFDIKASTGNAGALAGTLANVNVDNVIAYNDKTSTGITATSGNAGGLIGSVTNAADNKIENCAAALVVKSDANGNAGGLIGQTSGGSVEGCYSGGHTVDRADGSVWYGNPTSATLVYNVTATAGEAGGLIGSAVNTPISCSYSTCSVSGTTAGGFVSSASDKIEHCYATGLVKATGNDTVDGKAVPQSGAFAYSVGTGTVTDCHYFEIINEMDDAETGGKKYLTALGKNGTNAQITALDADTPDADSSYDADEYSAFTEESTKWTDASPYNSTLMRYYSVKDEDGKPVAKYNLPSVERLGATVAKAAVTDPSTGVTTPADFVATHYGDWPAPEIFVINE